MNIFVKLKSNKDYKRLFENFISLSILQGLNYILPLITFPYLVRVLGVEKFGLLSFATATIGYFQIITDYGFNLSATREIAIHRENKEKVQEIFSAVMTIKFGLMILSLILLAILVFSFEKFRQDWEVYFLTFGMVVGNTLFPVWFFQGMERMKYITFLNVLAKVFFTFSIFIFVKKQTDFWKVPLLNSGGFIISGILSIWFLYNRFGIKLINASIVGIKKYFLDSTQFFLSRVSVSIYTTSNAFFLGLFTNNTFVGYYAIAEKLYQALQYAYYPLNQVIYPYISSTKNSRLFKKIFKMILATNTVLVIFLFFTAGLVFNLLFSNNASLESILVFRILLISALIVVPSILLGYPFLAAMGYPEYANKSVIYSSVLHLIVLTILSMISYINIYTVAIMVVVTESFVFGYRIFYSARIGLWMSKGIK